jgi:hypothetical protein
MAALMAGRHDGSVGFRLTREHLIEAIRESTGSRKPPRRSPTFAAPVMRLQAGTIDEQVGDLLPDDWDVFDCLKALREGDDDDDDGTEACDAIGTPARLAYATKPNGAGALTSSAPHGPRPSSAPAWKQPALSPLSRSGEDEPWYERLAKAPRQKPKSRRRAAAAVSKLGESERCSSKEIRLRQRPRSTIARSHPLLPTLAGSSPAAKPGHRRGPEPPASRRLRQHLSAAASSLHLSPLSEPRAERTGRAHSAGSARHSVASRVIDLHTKECGSHGGASCGETDGPGSSRESRLGGELDETQRRLGGELDEALRELIARTGEETPQLLLHTLQRFIARERASAGEAEPPGQQGAADAHTSAESPVDRALGVLARHSGHRAHQVLLRSLGRLAAPDAVPAASAPPARESHRPVAPPRPRPRSALRTDDRPQPRHGQSMQVVEKPVLYGEVAYPRRRSAAAPSAEPRASR